jgi:signal transduction histidine kinase
MTLEPLLPWVKIDVTQMQMVLSAVVANAGEAMSQGGTVSIRCERHTIDTLQSRRYDVAAGDYVLLTVGDEGTGMDAQTLQRVFEPFFSTKYQGRGLGMAAVYGIVRNHNGHVTVHSLPGEGTRVNIYLPALQSAAVVTSPLSPARNGLRNQRSSVRS